MMALGSIVGPRLMAQSMTSVLPSEPPSSLFASTLGDADVEVLAQGFWEASILSSGAWSGGSELSGFNAVPFLFTQTPDLYVFLRYKQRWVFESYVTNNLQDSLFSLAFEGGEGDFLKSVRLGNANISMPQYPFMSFGSIAGSFGATMNASDAERGIALDAMVRWDGLNWKTRTFFGNAEAQESIVQPGDDLRGRRFVFPDKPIVALSLVESLSTGNRTLSADEYTVSLATGVVLLNAEPRGTLSATYTPLAGVEKSIDIYEFDTGPGGSQVRMYNQYEARNLYALPDTSSARRLFVRNLATGTTDMRFSVSRVSSSLIQVLRSNGSAVPDPDPLDDDYMRPFYDETPWIYDKSNGVQSPYSYAEGFGIVAVVVESSDSIVLDQNTVDGTVTVYRDGSESSAFTYDPQARSLVLSPPPRSGEQIQIRYAVESSDRSDGALAFGLGARFPWLGVSWSAAVGGRWPLFGLGYDSAGEIESGWTGVSVGAAMKTEQASWDIRSMARYQRAGASGLYRIAGMEDYGVSSYLVPFRPVSGDVAGVIATTVLAADLGREPAFSDLLSALHPKGSGNRAIELKAGEFPLVPNGDETRFVRYVDAVPLSSYDRLVFFIKAEGVPSGSKASIRVGDGVGKGASVSILLDSPVILDSGWRKIELELDPAARVIVSGGDGSVVAITGIVSSYTEPAAAGLIEILVEGLTTGSVTIDELVLEGSKDGFAGLFGADFFIGDPTKRQGLYLGGTGFGVASQTPSLSSRIETGYVAKPIDVSLALSPAIDADTASFGIGYFIALPGRNAPTRLVDQFSRDVVLGRYARDIEAAASLGGFSASLSASSDESSSREAAAFSQNWKAKAGYGTMITSAVAMSLAAPVSRIHTFDLADSWLSSWRLMLPAAESDASSRRLEGSVQALDSRLTASMKRYYKTLESAQSMATAKASLPFSLGIVSLAPFYGRSTSLEQPSASLSFMGDVDELSEVLSRGRGLWSSLPIVELVSREAFPGFELLAADAMAAEHKAELGVELRRSIGFGIVDLFVPSTVTTSYARLVTLRDDTRVDSSMLSITLLGGAANVFASLGAVPLLPSVNFDEYSYKTALRLQHFASDGAVLPSFDANGAMSLELASGSTLAATSSLSIRRTRTATPWSGYLSLALETRPVRTWFGDLANMVFGLRQEPTDRTWVSDWMDSTFSMPPALKESFNLGLSASAAAGVDAPFELGLSFDYETRLMAAGSLTVGFGSSFSPSLSFRNPGLVYGLRYSFTINAKIVF